MADAPDSVTLSITKENYFIYSLFDELYIAIKLSKPYFNSIVPDDQFKNKKIHEYGRDKLYDAGTIKWYSDDFCKFENASYFMIEKINDKYFVTIKKSKEERESGTYFKTYSVRIRNSGSRYDPYNTTFMSMYQKLDLYNPEYHQIHIEEYLYNKSKKRVLSK